MANRLPEQKAANSERMGSFNSGKTFGLPTSEVDAGDRPVTYATGGDSLNAGRLKPGTEVHYNGSEGQTSIPQNSGAFTGRDNAPR